MLAGIPESYWTLGDAEFFGDPEALQAKNQYLSQWDKVSRLGMGMEFFSKRQGTGKTMLACLIGKTLVKSGMSVQFVYFRDIMSLTRKPFEVYDPELRRLRNASVLILDEVCPAISASQNAYFAGEFEDLIRFRTSGHGVTIMTTNLTPTELEDEYPRTYSLLSAKQKRIEVAGNDVRLAGEVDFDNMELVLNNEARPLQ
jgi:DNA replication protein DnaC